MRDRDLLFGAAMAVFELEVADLLDARRSQPRRRSRRSTRRGRRPARQGERGAQPRVQLPRQAAVAVELLVDAREEGVVVPHDVGQPLRAWPPSSQPRRCVVDRRRRPRACCRYSSRMRLNDALAVPEVAAAAAPRTAAAAACRRPPTGPRNRDGCGPGTRGPRPTAIANRRSSRVGSPRKSSIDGSATPSRHAAPGSVPPVRRRLHRRRPCALLRGHDGDGHLGDDFGVQLDAHRVLAQRLDAALEIDLPAIDLDPLAPSARRRSRRR